MKIKEVIKNCKRHKCINVIYAEDGKWMGDGQAFFLMPKQLNLEKDNIALLYDFSESEQEKIIYSARNETDTAFNFYDDDETETDIRIADLSINLNGKRYQIIETDTGILAIDGKYLEVLTGHNMAIKKRETEDGTPYIVIKEGLILTGVIIPEKVMNDILKNLLIKMSETLS